MAEVQPLSLRADHKQKCAITRELQDVTDVGWPGMTCGSNDVGAICGAFVEERREGAKEGVVMKVLCPVVL